MLTRERLAGLPLVLHDAVRLDGGAWVVALEPDAALPLTNGGEPVRSFVEGWRPIRVLTLFRPLLLLEFRHEDGRHAHWLLDGAGRFLGNGFAALAPPLLDAVRRRAAPALAWLAAMPGAALACAPPQPVLALAELGPETQDAIQAVAGAAAGEGPPLSRPALQAALTAAMAAARLPAPDPAAPIRLPMPLLLGWRFVRTVTACAPVLIVELLHEDGREAVWYLDQQLRYVGNAAVQLGGAPMLHLRRLCETLFETLADRVIMAPTLPAGPELDWFLGCARATRTDLLEFHLGGSPLRPPPAHAWLLTDPPPPPPLCHAAPTPRGRVVLEPEHARAACAAPLRDELFRLLRTGRMRWTSPVDGRRFEAEARPLYIDNLCFAYRAHDPLHDLTWYVIASAAHFRTFALFFPSANLVVAESQAALDEVRFYAPDAGAMLLRHAARFGPTLLPALLAPPGEVVHAFRGCDAILLGHFVWQDLSGICAMIDAVPPERLPRCLVFETGLEPEIYGPLDEIFPELEGRVERIPASFNDSIDRLYRERLTVIKSTAIRVPAAVGTRIVAALRRAPRWAAVIRAARAARTAGPLLLVGLRAGNRTIDGQEGFVERLIALLAAELGSLTVVLDGQNGTGRSGVSYASFGDTQDAAEGGQSAFLRQEAAIAGRLARRYAGGPVRIVSLIGRPVQESVIWCGECDLFVAPWGAALAKYRWVCNRPGLATIGRWNLERRNDLHIYHDPRVMDAPTPMLLNEADATVDVEEPVPGDRERANYRLDEDQVFAQIRGLLALHVPPSRRTGAEPDAGPAPARATERRGRSAKPARG